MVAGGGIGGLVTALALHQRDIEAVVLEQSTQLEAVGAGIQISPNACHVLDKLDLLDALRSHAFEPRSIDITDGRRERLLATDVEVPHALNRYQVARDGRARRVQATAARNGLLYQADSRSPRYVRDTMLRVLGSIGGSAFLARFDWLYNFDVTASARSDT